MSAKTIDDNQLLIRYLLGSLPEEEIGRLDEFSVTQEDFTWRLRAVENDMVDAYVKEELAGETLDRFRSFYLASPKRRDKVMFARALLVFTGKEAPPRTRSRFSLPLVIPRWAFACGAAAAAIFAGFLIYNQRQLQKEVSQLQTSRSGLQQRQREMQRELDGLSPASTQPAAEQPATAFTTLAVVLAPPTRGIERAPIVTLSSETSRVAIDMQLEADEFPLYRVMLTDAGTRQTLWRSGDVKSHTGDGRATVTIVVPAEILKSRRYLLELSSASGQSEPIGNYPFNVLEK